MRCFCVDEIRRNMGIRLMGGITNILKETSEIRTVGLDKSLLSAAFRTMVRILKPNLKLGLPRQFDGIRKFFTFFVKPHGHLPVRLTKTLLHLLLRLMVTVKYSARFILVCFLQIQQILGFLQVLLS